ncbi:olfactory receptor 52K2-like [Emydura macquarii macquarii]|uniref:olfactory receptor 52K2-like n=1 Tax=Emydura macquarii macquarii TaxID=1129001 RepID=UPI00352ADB1A
MLAPSNTSTICSSSFILLCLPVTEHEHRWISIPFGSIYITALLSNVVRLFIKAESGLHEPTSLFVSMLALTDIALSSSALPRMLGTFWVRTCVISCASCLAQMFLTHVLCVVKLGKLVVMAFDCYVPISALLRYTSMLTGSVIAKLVRWLLFCHSRIIYHPYCKHVAMVTLSCGTAATALATVSLPNVHIFLSNLTLLVPAMLNPLVYVARPSRSDRMLRTLRLGEDAL